MPPMPPFEDIVHKALSSEVRRDIILSLADGDKYLTEIANEIKKKPQTIDFHLTLLQEIGIVESEWKQGKKYYKLMNKEIVNFLRNGKPVPTRFRPKPPHEIMIEAWDDMKERMDRIEKKLDKLLARK